MVLKHGHFGEYIRNTWTVLKCDAGEGWRRSVGQIMWEIKKCYTVEEEMNTLRTKKKEKKRTANWICHIFRRNCLLKHITEGKIEEKIEGTGRQGRRRKQLLADLTETRRYWKLKAEALYRTVWSSRFGRSYGPVVRKTTWWWWWWWWWWCCFCTSALCSWRDCALNCYIKGIYIQRDLILRILSFEMQTSWVFLLQLVAAACGNDGMISSYDHGLLRCDAV
jgi:hypothetical protein